jgi:hypothetical protein
MSPSGSKNNHFVRYGVVVGVQRLVHVLAALLLITSFLLLLQELAAAHALLAAKKTCMNEEQQQNFSVVSEIQHQEASIAECQVCVGTRGVRI